MKTWAVLRAIVGAGAAMFLAGCGPTPSTRSGGSTEVACAPAPPGPTDLGPATGESPLPEGATVFDLKYLPQIGTKEDIPYRSFWGYGGEEAEAKTDPFLTQVRQKATGKLHYDQNPSLKGRKWAAVEYEGQRAVAMYFDVNADAKLGENEKLLPVRAENNETEFITPDFVNVTEEGKEVLCRVLMQANFYEGSPQPNCMWSPAALLEGKGTLDGKDARLLLFASRPGGTFDQFGSCYYGLLVDKDSSPHQDQYIPRETLSTLISLKEKFYHLALNGHRTNGLPARVVLTKDTTPTGELALKLDGAESLNVDGASAYLNGTDQEFVYFPLVERKGAWKVPAGSYALTRGSVKYSRGEASWELWFRNGPSTCVKETAPVTVALGKPTLNVRALQENERYRSNPRESTTFKKGTKIYLEPKITGNGQELFTRFRQKSGGQNDHEDRPPQVTITGPNGKQVFSATMEYG